VPTLAPIAPGLRLALRADMLRADLVPAFALTALAAVTVRCERDRAAPVPGSHAKRSTSAVIYFEVESISTDMDALTALRPIALAARSNPGARIVVHGFANERHYLQANLDLAERRARSIARQLLGWSVMDSQITLAAAEAAPTDERGARCEVELIESVVAAAEIEGADVCFALHDAMVDANCTTRRFCEHDAFRSCADASRVSPRIVDQSQHRSET
jgi:hypothetical protein